MINAESRIPHIDHLVICVKCDKIYPEFFMVIDPVWKNSTQHAR
ncbi:MAG: hypothetical protein ACI8PG_000543 [Planctomycetota bacterium]|jgi:hypothetical protein